MKTRFLAIALCLVCGCMAMVAQKPRLMLLPDRNWCKLNGFGDESTHNGRTTFKENYDAAFTNSADLTNVESTLKALFTEPGRDFPLVSYNEMVESSDDDDALDDAYEGTEGGTVTSSAFEDLVAAKANAPDIYLKVGWSVDKVGLRKVVQYRLQAVDTYSNKAVAAIEGTSEPLPVATPLGVIIKQGLKDKMAEFEAKLISHFQDLQTNGREIALRVRLLDSAGVTFNTEYGGEELATLLNNWLSDNTVEHRFSPKQATRNTMSFDQVRIPFKQANGAQNNARTFVDALRKYLSRSCGLPAENQSRGLGAGMLYVGEK